MLEQQVAAADDEDRRSLEAFRRGDRRAFEALVRRHQKPVWAVALRFARDRDAAEDLAQRAFLLALERVDELRGAFRPWLMRIAVNLAKNHVRDHAKFDRGATPEGAHEPLPDEAIDGERRRRQVRAAMAGLSDRQREVVMLRIDAQLPFAEVALALEITENNAKVTFHQAVRRLRELIGGVDGGL